jgi:DNA-binding MarR family transcriptional regulator
MSESARWDGACALPHCPAGGRLRVSEPWPQVVRSNCHVGDCTPVWLCDTTDVVSEPLNDTELERLLAQLLRLVSPAVTAGGARPGSQENGAGTEERQVTPARAGNGTSPGEAAKAAQQAGIPAVSASEARALIELVAARGIAQGELGSLLGLEKSTVSRLAAGLERKGWVRRGRDEDNQRYVRLYLTPEGGVIAARLWQAWHSRQERILTSLSPEERTGLSAGLRGLVRGLAAEGILGEAGPGSAHRDGG